MRYLTGLVAIVSLAVGGLTLVGGWRGDADARSAARQATGDERVNKCAENGFRGAPGTAVRNRQLICQCLIGNMDVSFSPVERDIIVQYSYYRPPGDTAYLRAKTTGWSAREMNAFTAKIHVFLRVATPRCIREVAAAQPPSAI